MQGYSPAYCQFKTATSERCTSQIMQAHRSRIPHSESRSTTEACWAFTRSFRLGSQAVERDSDLTEGSLPSLETMYSVRASDCMQRAGPCTWMGPGSHRVPAGNSISFGAYSGSASAANQQVGTMATSSDKPAIAGTSCQAQLFINDTCSCIVTFSWLVKQKRPRLQPVRHTTTSCS
jgi:hypothetical protein